MPHQWIVILHAVGATLALLSGFITLNWQAEVKNHRRWGKVYLLTWAVLFSTGIVIASWHPGISGFLVLNWLGAIAVAAAYATVLWRRRLGRNWLRLHYNFNVTSLAFLVVATVNQVLPRVGVHYPMWVFWTMVASPFLVVPRYVAKLDFRYGFSSLKESIVQPAK